MALVALADERFEKAATPLFLLAALMQPTGILVALDEFSTGGDERHAFLLTSGALLIQQTLIFLKTRRTVLLFMTLFFAVWLYGTAMDLVDLDEDLIFVTLGLSVLLATYSIDRTPHAAITPFWYFVSSTAMLSGLFSLLQHSVVEILFLGAACGVVFLSTWVKSRTLLDEDLIFVTLGLSVLLATYSIDRTPHVGDHAFLVLREFDRDVIGIVFAPPALGRGDRLFLGAACGVVFLSTWVKSRTLLFVGTVAILAYVGYYTAEHFSDVVGWPIALMLLGLLLLGLSAAAFRINRKYIAAK